MKIRVLHLLVLFTFSNLSSATNQTNITSNDSFHLSSTTNQTNVTSKDSFHLSSTSNQTNITSNETDSDLFYDYEDYENFEDSFINFIRPTIWTWMLITLSIVIFFIGLTGNAFVCAAVYRNHSMRTVTNYFIVNLAVADFLVILICLPPSVVQDVMLTWFFGAMCCKIVLYLQTVSVTVSILTLTFISIDRWYAICYPLKFRSNTKRAKTFILIIWLAAFIFDIPELIVFTTQPYDSSTIYFTQCIPTWSQAVETNWQILKVFMLYVVPLLFMAVTYVHIIKVLWKSSGNHFSQNEIGERHLNFSLVNNASVRGQLRSRKKAAKMLVVVVVLFALCYLPVHLLSLLRLVTSMKNSDPERAFAFVSHWLCYFNSAVNPLVYNFMNGKFRKEFRRFLRCCSGDRNRDAYQMSSLRTGTLKTSSYSRNTGDSTKSSSLARSEGSMKAYFRSYRQSLRQRQM